MENEIWKDISGYEGLYQVSNLSNVKSLRWNLVMKISIGTTGYYRVNLQGKTHKIHRLVAIAFIPNPLNKKFINHKDGDKLNNSLTNLEWCTCSENNIHAFRTGLKTPTWKNKFGKNHSKSIPVIQYDLSGNFISDYASTAEAIKITGIKTISKCFCKTDRRKTSGGFIWKQILLKKE